MDKKELQNKITEIIKNKAEKATAEELKEAIEFIEDHLGKGDNRIWICNDCGMELIEPYCIDCNSRNCEIK